MSHPEFELILNSIAASFEDHNIHSTQAPAIVSCPPKYLWLLNLAKDSFTADQLTLMLEALPLPFRTLAFHEFSGELQKIIFVAMQDESRRQLIKTLQLDNIEGLLDAFDASALLELSEEIPERFLNAAFLRLDKADKENFEKAAQYSDSTAGHWVNFDHPIIYNTLKISSIKRIIERHKGTALDAIFVQDKQDRLVGEVAIVDILSANPETKVADFVRPIETCIAADLKMEDAADAVISSKRNDLPVLDNDNQLLGTISIQTAYAYREKSAKQIISVTAGLSDDEDLFAPIWRSSKNRAVWLGINLLTAFLASWCIGLFEHTLQQVVALAILMPIVASMGGISGSQTLTIIVRALALGKVTDANRKAILHKELKVGLVNGLLWAVIIGLCIFLWFGQILLGVTIAAAILVNIIVAVLSGVLIPPLLQKLNIDPALSGSVVLTTITDVVGFVVFLGGGALILT